MKMFRANYSGEQEDEYFFSEGNYNKDDNDVIEEAKTYGDLQELCEVDQDTECFNAIRLVWR